MRSLLLGSTRTATLRRPDLSRRAVAVQSQLVNSITTPFRVRRRTTPASSAPTHWELTAAEPLHSQTAQRALSRLRQRTHSRSIRLVPAMAVLLSLTEQERVAQAVWRRKRSPRASSVAPRAHTPAILLLGAGGC